MPITPSPLRYPGGKSSLSNFLASVLCLNGLIGSTYVEPFCGGAGAAINLLLSKKVSNIILNDIDPLIYSFWFSILNHTDDFIKKIELVSINIAEWHKQREALYSDETSVFDKGFATFFLNRSNRSGILHANPIGGIKQNGKWPIHSRFNKRSLIKKIEHIALHKDNIVLKNNNAINFIKNYILNITEKMFIYYDPPYYSKGPSLYMNALSNEDHASLAAAIINDRKNIWLMTYDKAKDIKSLYSTVKMDSFKLNYSANKHKKGEEILIYPHHVKLPVNSITPYYGSKIF